EARHLIPYPDARGASPLVAAAHLRNSGSRFCSTRSGGRPPASGRCTVRCLRTWQRRRLALTVRADRARGLAAARPAVPAAPHHACRASDPYHPTQQRRGSFKNAAESDGSNSAPLWNDAAALPNATPPPPSSRWFSLALRYQRSNGSLSLVRHVVGATEQGAKV